jgi:hypothetical protein
LNGYSSSINLPQAETPIPAPFKVADPQVSDLGQHSHLLAYALDNSPPAATGAYGFFTRLTSPSYLASDPFLIVFNNGLTEAQTSLAATTINSAAILSGDFNHDDAVNMADYNLWKQHHGEAVASFAGGDGNGNGHVDAADYTVWRNNLGRTLPAGRGNGPSLAVPEPTWVLLIFLGFSVLAVQRNSMRRLPAGRGSRALFRQKSSSI